MTAMPEPIIQIVRFEPDYSAMPDNNRFAPQTQGVHAGSGIGTSIAGGTIGAGIANSLSFRSVYGNKTAIDRITGKESSVSINLERAERMRRTPSGTFMGVTNEPPTEPITAAIANGARNLSKASTSAAAGMNELAKGSKLLAKAMHIPVVGMALRGLKALGPTGVGIAAVGAYGYYAYSQYKEREQLAMSSGYGASIQERIDRQRIKNAQAFASVTGMYAAKEREADNALGETNFAAHVWQSVKNPFDYSASMPKAAPYITAATATMNPSIMSDAVTSWFKNYVIDQKGMRWENATSANGKQTWDTFNPDEANLNFLKRTRPELFGNVSSQMVEAGSMAKGTVMIQSSKAEEQRDEIIRLLEQMAKDRRRTN